MALQRRDRNDRNEHPTRGALSAHRTAGPSAWIVALAAAVTGCSTVLDNAPVNQPAAPGATVGQASSTGIAGRNVIALSLSGGGMRASAFALGVLEAIAETPAGTDGTTLFDDITFVSSVSGGSLVAAYVGLRGRDGLRDFRHQVLSRDLESQLRINLWSPANWSRDSTWCRKSRRPSRPRKPT
jgi:NTE family protein